MGRSPGLPFRREAKDTRDDQPQATSKKNRTVNGLVCVELNEHGGYANPKEIVGWEKVDDTTVLERKKIRLMNGTFGYQIFVYDFAQAEVTKYNAYGNEATSTQASLAGSQSFIQTGPAAIVQAHEALTHLKGNPGLLSAALGLDADGKVVTPETLRSDVLKEKSSRKGAMEVVARTPVGYRIAAQKTG